MKKLLTLLIIASSLTLTSCSSNKKATSEAESTTPMSTDTSSSALEVNADSDSGKAGALQTVYFAFNSAALNDQTQSALNNNAQFLKDNAGVQVQVEGHCDERGGVQYNIALGEKRAKAIKTYLVSMGVDAGRVGTVSYGKERPIAFGHDEAAWGQNRRGNFVVTAK